jgi:hypothetical protein
MQEVEITTVSHFCRVRWEVRKGSENEHDAPRGWQKLKLLMFLTFGGSNGPLQKCETVVISSSVIPSGHHFHSPIPSGPPLDPPKVRNISNHLIRLQQFRLLLQVFLHMQHCNLIFKNNLHIHQILRRSHQALVSISEPFGSPTEPNSRALLPP